MTKLTKALTTAAIVAAPLISQAQEKIGDLYTRCSVFGKKVNAEQMYGIQGTAGVPIGKYLNAEVTTGFSKNFSEDKKITEMDAGVYVNATTNNEEDIVASLGAGVIARSTFDNSLDKKVEMVEPAIKGQTELKVAPNTYIHAGWEYGLKSKDQKILGGVRVNF